jgi:RNA polymerase sigma-70 factor (ECF subfamily)
MADSDISRPIQSPPTQPNVAAVFESHGAALRRYVLGLVGDRATAEDLSQEAFLRAHRGLDGLQDPGKLVPWLYRIATNLCRDHLRQASRRAAAGAVDERMGDGSDPADPEPADQDSPRLDLLFEQSEMSACVQAYLDELPEAYRAVIVLYDLEGLSGPEIARTLGCSPGAVKVRLHRARARLRAALDEACAFSRDGRGVFVCEPKPPLP